MLPAVRTVGGPRPPLSRSWRTTPLEAMDQAQWESLCDGCGRCCLVKLEDDDTGKIHATDIACRLFDAGSCRCRDYANRTTVVPDCVGLTPKVVRSLSWLPPTCGYRLVAEGQDLAWLAPYFVYRTGGGTVRRPAYRCAALVHCGGEEMALEHRQPHPRYGRWPGQRARAAHARRCRPATDTIGRCRQGGTSGQAFCVPFHVLR